MRLWHLVREIPGPGMLEKAWTGPQSLCPWLVREAVGQSRGEKLCRIQNCSGTEGNQHLGTDMWA
jgi:hypothetical protein